MKKILIVERLDGVSEMYRNRLEEAGHRVKIVNNSTWAISIAEEWKPDLITTAILMPRLGGLELIEKIRQSDRISTTDIIIISNVHRSDLLKEARRLNVLSYINKSKVTPVTVTKLINDYLEGKSIPAHVGLNRFRLKSRKNRSKTNGSIIEKIRKNQTLKEIGGVFLVLRCWVAFMRVLFWLDLKWVGMIKGIE